MSPSEINRDLPEGATAIDPDEAEDLLPSHIRTRGELNVWEQENILEAVAWVERTREEVFPPDEAAVRLHHRLVFIHPFPNGNGRHARLWCDMLLSQIGRPTVDWGGAKLDTPGDHRKAYLGALLSTDQGDLQPLLSLFLQGRTP